jgi:hypothetical protein
MCLSRRYSMKVLHTPGGMHPRPAWVGSTGVPPAVRYASASSSALASLRSAVSKPSVNQW